MKPRVSSLHGTVRAAGWVSFFTDFSSDMILPLLPLFLRSVLQATTTFIGLIEGAAETTASLLKLFSGVLSDRMKKRKALVLAGYGLSSVTRPLIAAATAGWHVLAVRMADRVGKGIRTSPRDALIADHTPAALRGLAFGFQRAMDNAGAIVGPLAGAAVLWVLRRGDISEGHALRIVFLLAAVPGLLAPFIIWRGMTESPVHPAKPPASALDPASPGRRLGKTFWLYMGAVVLFTLGNSSDAFLILRANDAGVAAWQIPLLWAAFNAVKAMSSTWGGQLSDVWGRKRMLLTGWTIYAASYLLFGLAARPWQMWLIMVFYGLYYGCVEASERAIVADLVPAETRGSAYGIFHGAVGIMALPASVLFGWIWQRTGSPLPPFAMGAALAACAGAVLPFVRMEKPRSESGPTV
jgi:MFS family permease